MRVFKELKGLSWVRGLRWLRRAEVAETVQAILSRSDIVLQGQELWI